MKNKNLSSFNDLYKITCKNDNNKKALISIVIYIKQKRSNLCFNDLMN